ncbi:hypothetical protein O1M63_19345 [Streptomyces mirabilis]|nr:hypothetical protein [Streptomyces mirabilis]
MRRADLAHPWVKRVRAPLLCAALGVLALRDAADGIGRGVPVVLALIAGYRLPLLWRQQRPVLVFALTSAVGVVGLVMDVSTGSEAARIVALLNVGRKVGPARLVVCMAIAVAQTSVGSSPAPPTSRAARSWGPRCWRSCRRPWWRPSPRRAWSAGS